MRWALSCALAIVLLGCLDGQRPKGSFRERWETWGGARVLIAGGTDGRGGGDGPVLVYLHGFASRSEDQLPLRDELDAPAGTRFVFPEAPIPVTISEGPRHAWWMLDRTLRQRWRAEPNGMRELASHRPDGLLEARAHVSRVLDGVERRMGAPPERTVIAGFSQGAMLACDVALAEGRAYAGLGVLSGTLIDAQEWRPRMARHRDLPVFVTHGRADDRLPFAMAERLVALFEEEGLDVRWHPHDGGHAMNDAVLPAFGEFLDDALAPSRSTRNWRDSAKD